MPGAPALPEFFAGSRMAVIGDSIDIGPTMDGFLEAIGQQFTIPAGWNFAISGTEVVQKTQIQDYVSFQLQKVLSLTTPPDIVYIGGYENSLTHGDTSAHILAGYASMIAQIEATFPEAKIIIRQMAPSWLAGQTAFRIANGVTVAAGLVAMQSDKVLVVDTSAYDHTLSGAGYNVASTRKPDASNHPNASYGAPLYGEIMAQSVLPLIVKQDPALFPVGPGNLTSHQNLNPDWDMAGTGGSFTGATGQLADGWVFANTSDVAAVLSKGTVESGATAQVISFDGVATVRGMFTDTLTITPTTTLKAGQAYTIDIELEISDNAGTGDAIGLYGLGINNLAGSELGSVYSVAANGPIWPNNGSPADAISADGLERHHWIRIRSKVLTSDTNVLTIELEGLTDARDLDIMIKQGRTFARVAYDDPVNSFVTIAEPLPVVEGTDADHSIALTATRLHTVGTTEVPYIVTVTGDNALRAADFALGLLPTGHIDIADGVLAGTSALALADDGLNEGAETALLTITRPSTRYSVGTGSQVIVVNDDDGGASTANGVTASTPQLLRTASNGRDGADGLAAVASGAAGESGTLGEEGQAMTIFLTPTDVTAVPMETPYLGWIIGGNGGAGGHGGTGATGTLQTITDTPPVDGIGGELVQAWSDGGNGGATLLSLANATIAPATTNIALIAWGGTGGAGGQGGHGGSGGSAVQSSLDGNFVDTTAALAGAGGNGGAGGRGGDAEALVLSENLTWASNDTTPHIIQLFARSGTGGTGSTGGDAGTGMAASGGMGGTGGDGGTAIAGLVASTVIDQGAGRSLFIVQAESGSGKQGGNGGGASTLTTTIDGIASDSFGTAGTAGAGGDGGTATATISANSITSDGDVVFQLSGAAGNGGAGGNEGGVAGTNGTLLLVLANNQITLNGTAKTLEIDFSGDGTRSIFGNSFVGQAGDTLRISDNAFTTGTGAPAPHVITDVHIDLATQILTINGEANSFAGFTAFDMTGVRTHMDGTSGDDTLFAGANRFSGAGRPMDAGMAAQSYATLNGLDGNDRLLGGGGDDRLYGGAGNDMLRGAEGDDQIDGGEGSDTALFDGSRSDYAASLTASGIVIQDLRADMSDGTDKMINVEFFAFSNGTVTLDQLLNPHPPTVGADALALTGGIATTIDTANLLANDQGAVGEPLQFSSISNVINATVSLVSGQLRISDVGADASFDYAVISHLLGSATGHVSLSAVAMAATGTTFTAASDFTTAHLVGLEGNDNFTGSSGDDSLTGAGGDDVIDGNGGIDTAVYSGTWTDYTIAVTDTATMVSDERDGAPDGTDIFSNIEYFQFANGVFTVAQSKNAGPIAIQDNGTALVEAGVTGPGTAMAAGNVLTNDSDPNLATALLGETLCVKAIAAGDGSSAPYLDVTGPTQVQGVYGTLTIDTDGGYSYLLDDNLTATDALVLGQTEIETFSYQIADSHGALSTALLAFAISGDDDVSLAQLVTGTDNLLVTFGDPASFDASVLLANDTGEAGENFSISGISNISGAAVALNSGQIIITSSSANAAFDYVLTSSLGRTATGHVDVSSVVTSAVSDVIDSSLFTAASLNGRVGNDTLTGSNGNDILYGGLGNDVLDGGAGVDTASYADSLKTVRVSLNLAAMQNTNNAGNDTLLHIENLTGSQAGDMLEGNGSNNVLDGGNGNDTLTYLSASAGVKVSLSLTGPQDTIGAGIDTIRNFENLTGSKFVDMLQGNDGNNVLNGGGGADTVSYENASAAVAIDLTITAGQNTLGAGMDTIKGIPNLTGSAFDDILRGSTGTNIIHGGDGNDVLMGNAGADQLWGDNGADSFIYLLGNDSVSNKRDQIMDFRHVEGDRIDLSAIDANSMMAENQAFTMGGSAFTHLAGELIQIRSGDGYLVQCDFNGDAVTDFAIVVKGQASALLLSDFVL